MKAQQVPSDKWEKRVYKGIGENGEREYEVIYGDSVEDVEEKAKAYRRKKMMERQNKWQSENAERMSVVFEKGTKERMSKWGGTVNGFIKEAVKNELERRGL